MFSADTGLAEVPKDRLEAEAAKWLNANKRTIAPRSTRRRLTSMRTLGSAFGMEILKHYSAPTPLRAEPHPLPGGKEDLVKLLRLAVNEQQRVLIALLGMCGLRISEARGLSPRDVNLRDRLITVYGKGSTYRKVEISEAALDILFAYVAEAQLDGRTKLINYADRSARGVISDLARKASIEKKVASHDLRATFATLTYKESGNDIRVVQDLLGHRHITTTQVYVATGEDERRSAVEFMRGELL